MNNEVLEQTIDNDNFESEESCIICFGNKDLLANNLCDCKFEFHKKCYSDWIKISKINKCFVCNGEIDLTKLGINLEELDNDLTNNDLEDPNINIFQRLGEIVANPVIAFESIRPDELLMNIQQFIELPNIRFTYSWEITENNGENTYTKHVALSHIPEQGMIYYSRTSDGRFVTNLVSRSGNVGRTLENLINNMIDNTTRRQLLRNELGNDLVLESARQNRLPGHGNPRPAIIILAMMLGLIIFWIVIYNKNDL